MRTKIFKWHQERVLLAGGQGWLTSGQRTWRLHSNCVNRWRFGSLTAACFKQDVLWHGFNSQLTAPTSIILRNRDVQLRFVLPALPNIQNLSDANIFPKFNILSTLFLVKCALLYDAFNVVFYCCPLHEYVCCSCLNVSDSTYWPKPGNIQPAALD